MVLNQQLFFIPKTAFLILFFLMKVHCRRIGLFLNAIVENSTSYSHSIPQWPHPRPPDPFSLLPSFQHLNFVERVVDNSVQFRSQGFQSLLGTSIARITTPVTKESQIRIASENIGHRDSQAFELHGGRLRKSSANSKNLTNSSGVSKRWVSLDWISFRGAYLICEFWLK